VGLTGEKVAGIMPLSYGKTVRCITTATLSTGQEVTYFGSDDGYVYQDNVGTSFDGAAIEAWLRPAFNNLKSPRVRKQYRRAVFEVDCEGFSQVNIGYDLGYANPDAQPPAVQADQQLVGAGGYWDEFTWDAFTWDTPVVTNADLSLDGSENNIAFLFYSKRAQDDPHTCAGGEPVVHPAPARSFGDLRRIHGHHQRRHRPACAKVGGVPNVAPAHNASPPAASPLGGPLSTPSIGTAWACSGPHAAAARAAAVLERDARPDGGGAHPVDHLGQQPHHPDGAHQGAGRHERPRAAELQHGHAGLRRCRLRCGHADRQADAATAAKAASYNATRPTSSASRTEALNTRAGQVLSSDTQKSLQQMQSQYSLLMQSNNQAATAFNQALVSMTNINMNDKMDGNAKTQAIAQIQRDLQSQMRTRSCCRPPAGLA
jgi:hypothetical protein